MYLLLFSSDQSGEKEVDPNNPFSFKEFVRKDKRKAVYYTSKEDSVDQPTASQNEVVIHFYFILISFYFDCYIP